MCTNRLLRLEKATNPHRHSSKACHVAHQSVASLRNLNYHGHTSKTSVCKKLDLPRTKSSACTLQRTINLILNTCHSSWCCAFCGPLRVRYLRSLLNGFAEDCRQMSAKSPPAEARVSPFLLSCCQYGQLWYESCSAFCQ
jgi:hypothetical protein